MYETPVGRRDVNRFAFLELVQGAFDYFFRGEEFVLVQNPLGHPGVFQEAGFGEAGTKGHDVHSPVFILLPQRVGQAQNKSFGRGVIGHIWNRLERGG